jgi:hypothetical protein
LSIPTHNALYGGQVAAQALAAAGRTVATDRLPRSPHCHLLPRPVGWIEANGMSTSGCGVAAWAIASLDSVGWALVGSASTVTMPAAISRSR